MKTYFGLVVTAVAFVSSVHGDDCESAVQAEAFKSLLGVMASTNLTLCSSKSGYSMMTATALATEKQTADMCRVPECHSLIEEVKATHPPDCNLTNPATNLKMNVKVLADGFKESCTKMGISPNSPVSSSTTSATPIVTPAAFPMLTPVSPMSPPASTSSTPVGGADGTETERMNLTPPSNPLPSDQLFVMPIPNTAC